MSLKISLGFISYLRNWFSCQRRWGLMDYCSPLWLKLLGDCTFAPGRCSEPNPHTLALPPPALCVVVANYLAPPWCTHSPCLPAHSHCAVRPPPLQYTRMGWSGRPFVCCHCHAEAMGALSLVCAARGIWFCGGMAWHGEQPGMCGVPYWASVLRCHHWQKKVGWYIHHAHHTHSQSASLNSRGSSIPTIHLLLESSQSHFKLKSAS